jgi:hypothetical protein
MFDNTDKAPIAVKLAGHDRNMDNGSLLNFSRRKSAIIFTLMLHKQYGEIR